MSNFNKEIWSWPISSPTNKQVFLCSPQPAEGEPDVGEERCVWFISQLCAEPRASFGRLLHFTEVRWYTSGHPDIINHHICARFYFANFYLWKFLLPTLNWEKLVCNSQLYWNVSLSKWRNEIFELDVFAFNIFNDNCRNQKETICFK